MGKIMMPKNYFSSFFVKLFFRTLHLNKKALSYVSEMKYRPKPKIENGFIFLTGNESSREKKIIGTLFPQPLLEQNLDPSYQNMINSKNKSKLVQLYDKDYSDICDFNTCNYNCDWIESLTSEEFNAISKNINSDTYSEDFARDDIELAK